MVERAKSNRARDGKRRGKRGGFRPGGGRKPGTVEAFKRVARAKATMSGELPHELLLKWARSGRMDYGGTGSYRARVVELEPSDRIACAKGCAAWFKPAMQPRQAPGEQPPAVQLVLDPKVVEALVRRAPDKAGMLREVLREIATSGGDVAQLLGAQASSTRAGGTGAERYGRMLSEDSATDGSA